MKPPSPAFRCDRFLRVVARAPRAAMRPWQMRQGRKARAASLDHLVGAEQEGLRNRKTQSLGGLEIDDQFKFGRLHHRKIGRPGSLQYLSSIAAGFTISIGKMRAVTEQAANFGEFAAKRYRG